MEIKLTVNGTARSDEVEPRLLLVHYLREVCGLRAANVGCDTTSCGACTVLLDGESVKSCTVLAVQANGRSVTTAEGLVAEDGTMSAVQQAFRENHGLQCGFCTPGMVMAATSLLAENPDPTEQQVREGLEGNFCRCTGYHNIVRSVLAAAGKLSGAEGAGASFRGERMIPATFDYEVADSAAHALSLLAEHGEDAKLLAGGHSLLPMMKVRLAQPAVLVDIARVGELSGIRSEGDELVIGATTRHADVAGSDLVRAEVPLLAYAAAQVGDPQIRHRGTIGGSLAHADPSADLPMTLLALGGSVEITGPAGVRTVAADDFFVGPFETALSPDELLSAVRVPRGGDVPWGYQKFVRRANDWAIVGVAAYDGRVALANMGGTPLRALAVEEALRGGASAAEAAAHAADGTSPGYDFHADTEYRKHLARVLTKRALQGETG